MVEVSPRTAYRRGEWIEYSSPSREAWLPAQVARVHRDGTLTLDVTTSKGTTERSPVPDYMVRRKDRGSESPAKPRRDAALDRATTASGTQYQVGQTVEYSSESLGAWLPATVEAISPRAGVTLELTDGTVVRNVPTHFMRHRSASEILREVQEERARKARARRAAEEEARRLAQDEAEIRALQREIARKKQDAARHKRALRQEQQAAWSAEAHVGGAAGPPSKGPERRNPVRVVRLGDQMWYRSRSQGRDIRAFVEVLHSNGDITIRRKDIGLLRLTIHEARELLHY